jgi:hypothetical protein
LEKEQQLAIAKFSEQLPANPVAAFIAGLDKILPLPRGEGRGEGAGDDLEKIMA